MYIQKCEQGKNGHVFQNFPEKVKTYLRSGRRQREFRNALKECVIYIVIRMNHIAMSPPKSALDVCVA